MRGAALEETQNGSTARIRVLESQMDTVQDVIKDMKVTNSAEHAEIRVDVRRILGIGWGVLGGVAVGVIIMLVGRL